MDQGGGRGREEKKYDNKKRRGRAGRYIDILVSRGAVDSRIKFSASLRARRSKAHALRVHVT